MSTALKQQANEIQRLRNELRTAKALLAECAHRSDAFAGWAEELRLQLKAWEAAQRNCED